jgi:hypothetical protein
VRPGQLFRTVVLALMAAGAAACGGGGNGAAKSPAPATTAPATAAPTKPTSAAQPTKASTSARLPADACTLLTLDEVKQVIPAPSPGEARSTSGPTAGDERLCHWDDTSSFSIESLATSLEVSVAPLLEPRDLAIRDLTTLADPEFFEEEVTGVGDVARLKSTIESSAEVEAIVGDPRLRITFDAPGARDKRHDLVPLAQAAAQRLAQ